MYMTLSYLTNVFTVLQDVIFATKAVKFRQQPRTWKQTIPTKNIKLK